jgi:hypothetical protein
MADRLAETDQAGEQVPAFGVVGAHPVENWTGIAVVGGDHQQGVGLVGAEIEGDGEGIVEGKLFPQEPGGVVR